MIENQIALHDKIIATELEKTREAAKEGNVDALCELAELYWNGNIEEIAQNKKEAIVLYRKAADKGHVISQFNLARCYYQGDGVQKDQKEATIWYRKAAEQGDMEAQFSLGVCYFKGEGVQKNLAEALIWFRKAATQGHVNSAQILSSSSFLSGGSGTNLNSNSQKSNGENLGLRSR